MQNAIMQLGAAPLPFAPPSTSPRKRKEKGKGEEKREGVGGRKNGKSAPRFFFTITLSPGKKRGKGKRRGKGREEEGRDPGRHVGAAEMIFATNGFHERKREERKKREKGEGAAYVG